MRLLNTELQPIVVAFTSEGAPTTGLVVSIGIKKVSDGSDVSPSPATLVSIGLGLYALLSDKMPSTTDDVLAWRIDGSDTLANADRYKFGALVFGGDAEDRLDDIDISLSDIETAIPNKIGRDVSGIDHDFGGTDNLRALDGAGSPIANANIHIFLKTDWDAGNRTTAFVASNGAWSETLADGRWRYDVSLNAGTYIMVVQIPGHTQQTQTEFTVT